MGYYKSTRTDNPSVLTNPSALGVETITVKDTADATESFDEKYLKTEEVRYVNPIELTPAAGPPYPEGGEIRYSTDEEIRQSHHTGHNSIYERLSVYNRTGGGAGEAVGTQTQTDRLLRVGSGFVRKDVSGKVRLDFIDSVSHLVVAGQESSETGHREETTHYRGWIANDGRYYDEQYETSQEHGPITGSRELTGRLDFGLFAPEAEPVVTATSKTWTTPLSKDGKEAGRHVRKLELSEALPWTAVDQAMREHLAAQEYPAWTDAEKVVRTKEGVIGTAEYNCGYEPMNFQSEGKILSWFLKYEIPEGLTTEERAALQPITVPLVQTVWDPAGNVVDRKYISMTVEPGETTDEVECSAMDQEALAGEAGTKTIERADILKIWNGQDGATAVAKKFDVGAFTVANLNDTDGDGSPRDASGVLASNHVKDKDDPEVPGEKDLMKLHIGSIPGQSGKIKITVKSGDVKFWRDKEKNNSPVVLNDGAVFFSIPAAPAILDETIWIEATKVSSHVRDIEIWAGHEKSDGSLDDGIDKVKATAVWVDFKTRCNQSGQNLTRSDQNPNAWADVQDPMLKLFNDHYRSFGKVFNAPGLGTINYVIGFQFEVLPTGVAKEPSVQFDITRQKQRRGWVHTGGGSLSPFDRVADFPAHTDLPNDDDKFDDESVKPPAATPGADQPPYFIYSCDGPGIAFLSNPADAFDVIQRQNFFEFVRVAFEGNRPDRRRDERPTTPESNRLQGTIEGSRCSDKLPWHTRLWVNAATGQQYQETNGKKNDVELYHKNIEFQASETD